MKLVKTANGKSTIKISKSEWEIIGKTTGWLKKAEVTDAIKNIPAELQSTFGGRVNAHSGENFEWEKTDEALGTAYLSVVYHRFDDIIYIIKAYENEIMDTNYGETIKIENASKNINDTKDKIFTKIHNWLGK